MRTKNVNRVFLYILFLYLIGAGLTGFFAPAFVSSEEGSVITAQVLILIGTLIGIRILRVNPVSHMRLRPVKITTLLSAMAATAALYPFLAIVSSLMQLFVKSGTDTFTDTLLTGNLASNLLLYALIPACIEELMHRGLLYNGYLYTCGIRRAIVLSALLFGLFHMNADQFAYTFLFGVFLCLVMEATDSLFSCMACHFTLNAVTVLTAFFADSGTADGTGTKVMTGVFAACGIAVCIVFFRLMLSLSGREEIFRQKLSSHVSSAGNSRGRIITSELVLSAAICLLYMAVYEIVM